MPLTYGHHKLWNNKSINSILIFYKKFSEIWSRYIINDDIINDDDADDDKHIIQRTGIIYLSVLFYKY